MTLLDAIIGGAKGNPTDFALGQARNYQSQAQQFIDPNSQFYTGAQSNYFANLNRTLNASSPGASQLLAAQTAAGGGYGGSTYVAGKQREAIQKQNADTASNSAQNYGQNLLSIGANLYGQNINAANSMYNLYGQGKIFQSQSQQSFLNQAIGLGGGLLARYFPGAQAVLGASSPVQTDYTPNFG